MLRLLCFASLLLLIEGCSGNQAEIFRPQKSPSERKSMQISGQVQNIRERLYEYRYNEDKEVVGEKFLVEYTYQFNHAGQLEMKAELLNDGETRQTLREYDQVGRLLGEIVTEDHAPYSETRRDFYDHGLIREIQEFNGNKELIYKTNYQYDDSLNLSKVVNYHYSRTTGGDRKETVFKTVNIRNEEGVLQAVKEFRDAELTSESKYGKGRVRQVTRYKKEGPSPVKLYYTYSAMADTCTTYTSDSRFLEQRVNTYDEKGLYLTRTDSSVTEVNHFNFSYTPHGHIAQEIYTVSKNDSIARFDLMTHDSFAYQYDSLNNWIRREHHKAQALFGYTTREITYFDTP